MEWLIKWAIEQIIPNKQKIITVNDIIAKELEIDNYVKIKGKGNTEYVIQKLLPNNKIKVIKLRCHRFLDMNHLLDLQRKLCLLEKHSL